jgi:hypothetical protein
MDETKFLTWLLKVFYDLCSTWSLFLLGDCCPCPLTEAKRRTNRLKITPDKNFFSRLKEKSRHLNWHRKGALGLRWLRAAGFHIGLIDTIISLGREPLKGVSVCLVHSSETTCEYTWKCVLAGTSCTCDLLFVLGRRLVASQTGRSAPLNPFFITNLTPGWGLVQRFPQGGVSMLAL